MVLKAEEKSTKRIRINEPVFFKMCKRVSVASSVLLLCLYANRYGSKWVFVCFMGWWKMIRSKHFITIDVRAIGQ